MRVLVLGENILQQQMSSANVAHHDVLQWLFVDCQWCLHVLPQEPYLQRSSSSKKWMLHTLGCCETCSAGDKDAQVPARMLARAVWWCALAAKHSCLTAACIWAIKTSAGRGVMPAEWQ
jgi:hypothetical protein